MRGSIHSVGNINLKGKKTARLSCGRCGMENLKEKYNKMLAMKEINYGRDDYKMSEMQKEDNRQ